MSTISGGSEEASCTIKFNQGARTFVTRLYKDEWDRSWFIGCLPNFFQQKTKATMEKKAITLVNLCLSAIHIIWASPELGHFPSALVCCYLGIYPQARGGHDAVYETPGKIRLAHPSFPFLPSTNLTLVILSARVYPLHYGESVPPLLSLSPPTATKLNV